MSTKPVLDWDNEQVLNDIRAICPAQLTKTEFATFINTCRSMNLNPFTKEIYCLKNGTAAMQIIVARDGYRKVAQREAEYDYHQTDAVYSNDKFRVYHGEVEHEYDLTNRGEIIGAYCTVKRKSSSKSMYAYIDYNEYNQKRNLWLSKPATMIKKVAEAHALRMAFQAVFVGTYDEDEYKKDDAGNVDDALENTTQNAQQKPVAVNQPMITEEQVERIDNLMQLADMSFERVLLGIEKIYNKKELYELTEANAKDFIRRLELRVKNDITKAESTSVEDKAANQEDKQNEMHEAVRDIRNQALDNTNQFTEI